MHATNPFPGRPFREDEYKYFFGRAEVLSELKRRICARRLVGLHGKRNVGKTSLLMAGLRPQLETQGYKGMEGLQWKTTGLVIDHNPTERLVSAIAKRNILHPDSKPTPQYQDRIRRLLLESREGLIEAYRQSDSIDNHNLLIFIDQFELFLEGDPTEDKNHFVNLIVDAAHDDNTAIYFVISTRSEALPLLNKYPELQEMMEAGSFPLYPMGQRELVHALRKPLAAVRQQIDDDLLMTLVEKLSEEEDQLSTLQTIMYRTWYTWADSGSKGPLKTGHYRTAMKIKAPIGELKIGDAKKPEIKAKPKADTAPVIPPPSSDPIDIPKPQKPAAQHPGDAIYQGLKKEDQAILTAVFKALVKRNVYTENKFMSRPSMLETVAGLASASIEKIIQLIQPFRDQHLIQPEEGDLDAFSTLEVGGDKLWEKWDTLKQWIQAETKDASMLIKLDKMAEKREADPGTPLLSGKSLQEMSDWFKRFKPGSIWAEQYIFDAERPFDYLKASQQAAGMQSTPSKPSKKPAAPEKPAIKPEKRPQIKIGGNKSQNPPKDGERPKISIKSRKKP